MTLRGGGRPRIREPQAHPLDGSEALPPARPLLRAGAPVRTPLPPSDGGGGGHGSPLRGFAFLLASGVVVLVLLAFVVWPLVTGALGDWAVGNPSTWRLPLLGDLVAQRLAPELQQKASDDPADVEWVVVSGDTVQSVADRLVADGLIRSKTAFLYASFEADLGSKLMAGTFRLNRNMTPPEVARALIEARVVIPTLDVTFREGLRLEQITAKLETIQSAVDPRAFYDLVTHPSAALLADYPWLKLEPGATLEGYLYPATYTIRTDRTTAEQLVRMMLDTFYQRVGTDRLQVPASRGMTFAQVLALASIVEQEAKLDEERPLIAGVYQNRLATRPYLLNADPTVIYAVDGAALAKLPFDEWKTYSFWNIPSTPMAKVDVPAALVGYQTYTHPGLIPGPISSPTVASIDAALQPDTADKYLYFVLIPDSGGKHAFAKTYAEHLANLKKYGYQ